ncbi:unnamed protein product [Meloidogyne enterolobii]|uniref:Uncharacterized protein n=2 Tax=Meloidogyne enterolobii TaxID=390850 RepID=A0A6V7VW59_MELEN|nr:unnamed protein product [Meloidogyne enterolobii]
MTIFLQINPQKIKEEWNDEVVNEEFGEIEGREEDWQSSSSIFLPRVYSNDAKMAAILLCDVLGVLCILLNAFVIIALIRNRRRVLVNVFYVMVLHCAIVDLIRGGCLIAWGMPHLLVHTMRSIQDRLTALKAG